MSDASAAPTDAPVGLLSPEEVAAAQTKIQRLLEGLGTAILGQQELLELAVICILGRGHMLLEGLPGLGKTELVKSLSTLLGLSFRRVQFTPDLLPGDIVGSPILEEQGGVVGSYSIAVRSSRICCWQTKSTGPRRRRSRPCWRRCRSGG